MLRSEFCARLDERLRTDDYADLDASPNGLQVARPDDREVERVAFAVDAAVATAEAAAGWGADLLVTHHGIVWGGLDRVTGTHYRRVAPFLEDDLDLYVSHLPLDGHQELGNAAGVADHIDLGDREPFGELGPEFVGQRGRLPEATQTDALIDTLEPALDTAGEGIDVLPFGPDRIETVAIVTGSGVDWLDEAVAVGADALITGEGKAKVFHEARDAGITVVLGGHYATETFGIRSLAGLADDWGLATTVIDHPTGI